MEKQRMQLLEQLWAAQDEAYDLMCEYDALPHHYGENILYQAEGEMISLIAVYPDSTITELAIILKKTTSACSQIVRRLKEKGMVEQIRNTKNNRQFQLRLTEDGQRVYQCHLEFNQDCQKETFAQLEEFSEEQLQNHLDIQRKLNEIYAEDVRRSRDKFC